MLKNTFINILRIILALTFIFSGYVKAVDPIGTQYKLHDYLTALGLEQYAPDFLTLLTSIGLSTLEFAMGMFLMFAIYRRLVSKLMVVFMAVMTAVTLWIYIDDPVSDCGCFGDAIVLTNGQTLLKNIILLAITVVVAWRPLRMVRFISLNNQWIVFHYTFIFILATSVWSLYDLPIFDFRPYHIGVNIPKAMAIPEDAEQAEFETTFILEKDGVQKEFTLDDYPDSTWTFVDSRSVQISEGYVPPIHDFDIEDSILSHPGYTFLLISPSLEKADDSMFGDIDMVYEYAKENGYPFYCLTASGDSAQNYWRNITGAEYPFSNVDETALKTVIRSNPGMLLIKDGTIIQKWSHNSLPVNELLAAPLEKSELGHISEDSTTQRIIRILLWFVLPLTLLSIADRTWYWTKWVRLLSRRNPEKKRLKKASKKKRLNV